MGRASTGKKVSRIASTGGGRTARGRTPWLWYGGITAVLALGVALVITSRQGLNPEIGHPNFQDHWHTAYGVYICDQFRPPMPQPANLIGIHTHTDGLMHVEPTSVNDTAEHATVGRFATGQPGFKISATRLQYPGDRVYKNGDKCGTKKGVVQALIWSSRSDDSPSKFDGDPSDIKLKDGELVTFAFAPAGTTIPKPPSAGNLANPNKMEGQPAGEPTTPESSATTAPAATPTTTAQ